MLKFHVSNSLKRHFNKSQWKHLFNAVERCDIIENNSIHVTRQKHPLNQNYSLDSKKLEVVNYHKHLGVTISETLSWDYHINSICAKARRIMGFKSPAAVEVAFKTLVRPARLPG